MGNLLSSSNIPTNKLSGLLDVTNDFSANVSQNISANVVQEIIVSQNQLIQIKDSTFKNCRFEASQDVNIMAKQVATFKAVLSKPKDVIRNIAQGPNSIFGQAFSSTNVLIKQFLDTAKSTFGSSDLNDLRGQFTNIVKINVNQSVINKAIQRVTVVQTQNVLLDNFTCENSTVTIKQTAAIDAMQQVLSTIVIDALGSNPQFRQALRKFNGEYDQFYLESELDQGIHIPDACASDLLKVPRDTFCPPCEDCPPCVFKMDRCPPPPTCEDFVLSAKFFYGFLSITSVIIIILLIVKIIRRK